jgi:hypothetical protein
MYSNGSAVPATVRPRPKTANSAAMSPRVQPAPQWLTPVAMVAQPGLSGGSSS